MTRAAAAGGSALAVAAGCLVVTALLGPSAAQPQLGSHDGSSPPFHLEAHPAAWVVTALPMVAAVAGAAAMLLLVTGRWRPPARLLVGVGLAVTAGLALLPPIGSSDPVSYASYGRMVVTGHDPYATAPADLATHDPVAAAVEPPWQHEPAVYGPVATGEQAVAAWLGGADPAHVVWVLGLLSAAAFAGVGGLLLAAAGGDEDGRRRAAALWLANPLLWLEVVAGAHVDVLVALAAVAALSAGLRRPALAGALAAVAAAVKPPGGLVLLGVLWPLRRVPRRVAATIAAAAVVTVAAWIAVSPEAESRLSHAARRVSHATPWRPVVDATHLPRGLVGALALLQTAALALLLLRHRRPGAAAVAVAVTMGYVLAAPYALPWYDALPWALLPFLAASWRDLVLLAHTTVLAVAYLPGRDAVRLHGTLGWLTTTMRNDIAPVLLTALLVAVAATAVSRDEGPAGSGRSPAAP